MLYRNLCNPLGVPVRGKNGSIGVFGLTLILTNMTTYILEWTPEGRIIGHATRVKLDRSAAKRLAPKPYRRFLGEIEAYTPEEYAKIVGHSVDLARYAEL